MLNWLMRRKEPPFVLNVTYDCERVSCDAQSFPTPLAKEQLDKAVAKAVRRLALKVTSLQVKRVESGIERKPGIVIKYATKSGVWIRMQDERQGPCVHCFIPVEGDAGHVLRYGLKQALPSDLLVSSYG